MPAASLAVAFAAGVLTILSPCVLPLVPMVLGSAASEHRWAPIALAAGVGVAFAVIGGVLASAGFAAGFDGSIIRPLAALLLLVIGLVLMVPLLQTRFAVAAGPLSNWANTTLGGFSTSGLTGQFLLGLLLGAVWTPCAGPTLGAASLLASRGENLPAVVLTMLLFGLGTGAALAALGLLSRAALMSWRDRLMGAGRGGKMVLGAGLMLVGLIILTGAEKSIETYLVDLSPNWLTQLTTRL